VRNAGHDIHVKVSDVLQFDAAVLLDSHVAIAVAVVKSIPNQFLDLLWVAMGHLLELTDQVHVEFLAVGRANGCADSHRALWIYDGFEAMKRRTFFGEKLTDRFVAFGSIIVLCFGWFDCLTHGVEHLNDLRLAKTVFRPGEYVVHAITSVFNL